MRIGIYVAHVAVRPGYEDVVSGHAQLPLHTARLLRDAGEEVHLITTRAPAGRVWPRCVPPGIAVHEVDDPSRQGARVIAEEGKRSGVNPLSIVRWALQMRRLVRDLRLDVLHFFGANRTAHLAGLCRTVAAIPAVTTFCIDGFPERLLPVTRMLWRRVDRIIATTAHLEAKLQTHELPALLLRHGVMRDIAAEVRAVASPRRHRVLFWREATPRNGGDVARDVVSALAPRHAEIQFDFALRPNREQVPGLEDLAATHRNVAIYQVPYPAGVTLARLLAESICVLQPFRLYTFQPQLSILESLAAGVPVIAADIESTRELVEAGVTGLIVLPGDVDATRQAVEQLLADPAGARRMGEHAERAVRERWTWDGYAECLRREYAAVTARTPVAA